MMAQLLNTPLFWTALTIAAFMLGQRLYKLSGNNAFMPPIFIGLVIVVLVVEVTNTSFATYMKGGDYLHQMLGLVVVMLAVPMMQFMGAMRRQWLRIILAVSLGSAVTIGVAGLLAWWLIGDDIITKTIFAKSVTTPVAIAITEQVGGIAALASVFVMITGVAGALLVPPLLKLTKLDEPQAMGVTLGVCAHAIGTSRALELGSQQSAYSAMAMTLTAVLHAIVLPLVL